MDNKNLDRIYFILVLLVLIALPLGISAYDKHIWSQQTPKGAKVFELTGHTQIGWILGSIEASDVLVQSIKPIKFAPPVITVNKGDTVVLKLISSDVIHGFSLKDFGIFINDGIHPGRPQLVTFSADKSGKFTFACNAICGSHHENMFGTIIVNA